MTRKSLNELFLPSDKIIKQEEELILNTDAPASYFYTQEDINIIFSYFMRGFNLSVLCQTGRCLYESFPDAFDNIIHAWMSELPVETEIASYGRKIIAAAEAANTTEEKRIAMVNAFTNRSDEITVTVQNAAAKVYHEIHRLMGLLRFTPDNQGIFTAHCEPDHLVIPALGEFFSARFGDTPWAIIDEKRSICLSCRSPDGICIEVIKKEENQSADNNKSDEWEELWKHYHQIINNESRNNPDLQRQFMPKRYWKYLPEVKT